MGLILVNTLRIRAPVFVNDNEPGQNEDCEKRLVTFTGYGSHMPVS